MMKMFNNNHILSNPPKIINNPNGIQYGPVFHYHNDKVKLTKEWEMIYAVFMYDFIHCGPIKKDNIWKCSEGSRNCFYREQFNISHWKNRFIWNLWSRDVF